MDHEWQTVELDPVGVVRSPRAAKRDDEWGGVRSTIEFNSDLFEPSALVGLDHFSHAEVIFYMHRVRADEIEWESRRPRNNPDWPEVGIFAQRAKGRPNRLGLSRCRIESVEGLTLTVRDLDAIDGTPVLDLKPYMREFGPREPVKQPSWVSELMTRYYD